MQTASQHRWAGGKVGYFLFTAHCMAEFLPASHGGNAGKSVGLRSVPRAQPEGRIILPPASNRYAMAIVATIMNNAVGRPIHKMILG